MIKQFLVYRHSHQTDCLVYLLSGMSNARFILMGAPDGYCTMVFFGKVIYCLELTFCYVSTFLFFLYLFVRCFEIKY